MYSLSYSLKRYVLGLAVATLALTFAAFALA